MTIKRKEPVPCFGRNPKADIELMRRMSAPPKKGSWLALAIKRLFFLPVQYYGQLILPKP